MSTERAYLLNFEMVSSFSMRQIFKNMVKSTMAWRGMVKTYQNDIAILLC